MLSRPKGKFFQCFVSYRCICQRTMELVLWADQEVGKNGSIFSCCAFCREFLHIIKVFIRLLISEKARVSFNCFLNKHLSSQLCFLSYICIDLFIRKSVDGILSSFLFSQIFQYQNSLTYLFVSSDFSEIESFKNCCV